ncbi:MAG: hypothetical protein DME18_03795 [Verrucomicrobia bacterium]|nr:MAG: hypothetical protein DME18_03795 [Verrucomicrobiota bacterium]
MGASKTKRISALMAVAAFVAAALFLLSRGPLNEVGVVRPLGDGSTLELRQVLFTNGFQYNHRTGNRLLRLLSPVTPAFIRNRFFPPGGGGFGFGSDGSTNLIVITVNRSSAPNWWSSLARLRIFDDRGNVYDARWGAHTLGLPGEVVHGWQIRAFPRRSETLGLRFLAQTPDGSWTNAGEFTIRNPAYADYPHWTPQPWPSTRSDGGLAVTLSEFQSGGRMLGKTGEGDEQTAARKTRLVFTFAEDGRPVNHWRVQKLTLSDATGNRWFPYLDFVNQNFDWVTNGTVEFFGALWPGEQAWKLDVECIRTGGFSADELWETPPIQLPAFGQLTDLTNHWQHDGVTAQLVALASPNTDHPGQFKWIAKWWGEDKNKVYSLALKLSPELNGRRLTVVRAVDQGGREVEIVQHGSQDNAEQAVFLKPPPESRELKLSFALQRSRFVRFLARPGFVEPNMTNTPVGK